MSIEAEAINESEPAAVRKVYLIPFSQAIRIKDIPEGINGDAYSIALSWDGDVEGEPAWCTHETLEGLRALGLEPEIEGERRILPVFHGSMRWIETVNYEEILSCLAYAKYDEDVSGIVYVGCNCERDVWQRGLPELKDSFFYYSQNEMRPYIWLAVTSDLTARFAYSLYHQDDNLAAWLEEIGYIDLDEEEKAPGNCILMDQGLMEYSCLKHDFSPTRPAIIEIVRRKLDNDPAARKQLREAMERLSMGEDGYVSMTDAVSLANFLPQVFPDIQRDAFDNVYIRDLKKLGREILCSQ